MGHQYFRQLVFWQAVHPPDIDRNAFDALQQLRPCLLIIGADGQLHRRLVRNNVVLEAAVEGADCDHAGLERRDFTADDRLQGDDDFRAHQDRILAAMGRSAMRANAVDNDVDAVGRAAFNAFADRQLSGRRVRRNVKGHGIIRLGKTRIEAVIHHQLRTANAFLGRLCNQHERAGPLVFSRCHLVGGADQ